MELGHPRIRLDRALAAVEELPEALRSQPLPGEEPEAATVTFGWSGLGRVAPPPGSMRVS
jgi:hypothetical protein